MLFGCHDTFSPVSSHINTNCNHTLTWSSFLPPWALRDVTKGTDTIACFFARVCATVQRPRVANQLQDRTAWCWLVLSFLNFYRNPLLLFRLATRGRVEVAAGHCELVKHPPPPRHQLGTSRCLGGGGWGGIALLCSLPSQQMSWKMRGGEATPPSQDPVHFDPPPLSLNTAAAF